MSVLSLVPWPVVDRSLVFAEPLAPFAFRSSFAELFDFDFSSSAPELLAFRVFLAGAFCFQLILLGRALAGRRAFWLGLIAHAALVVAVAPGPFARLRPFQSPGHAFPPCPCSGSRRRLAILPRANPKACCAVQRHRRRFRPLVFLAPKPGQRRPSVQRFRAEVSYSFAFHREILSGLFHGTALAVPRIRGETDAATIMFLFCYARSHDVFRSLLKAAFAQMSPTARFTYFLPISGTELTVPLLAQ